MLEKTYNLLMRDINTVNHMSFKDLTNLPLSTLVHTYNKLFGIEGHYIAPKNTIFHMMRDIHAHNGLSLDAMRRMPYPTIVNIFFNSFGSNEKPMTGSEFSQLGNPFTLKQVAVKEKQKLQEEKKAQNLNANLSIDDLLDLWVLAKKQNNQDYLEEIEQVLITKTSK